MGILACIGVILPFPFYYYLWNHPQSWVNLCGRSRDPCKIMALVSHFIKIVQFVSLFSVSDLHWPPPFYFWPLFLFGQFLNFSSLLSYSVSPSQQPFDFYACRQAMVVWVYQLLGEPGTYYGVRFGKNIPWVTEFPFGVIRDPQYVGSIISLVGCLPWVPYLYIGLWVLGYVFMIQVESKEDPSTRAKALC
ncbi:hypothetical protein SASPL_128747 [Salvia splendens]|uniref:phosphatidyl-N-methylethanolamine N-methyltransferase n=1 Tax=Salvia splendens TaxID=180675 RepID=A0A8X8ZMU2_SALSN|nr:hypothetical protein SASPL_128747 [Salvia splendens]